MLLLCSQSCTVVAVASNLSQPGGLYEVGQFMNGLVQQQLTGAVAWCCDVSFGASERGGAHGLLMGSV